MMKIMSRSQFVESMAYYQLEPWGEERADIRSGQLLSMYANCHRDPAKSSPYTIDDFLLFKEKQETPEEPPEVLAHRIHTELFGLR